MSRATDSLISKSIYICTFLILFILLMLSETDEILTIGIYSQNKNIYLFLISTFMFAISLFLNRKIQKIIIVLTGLLLISFAISILNTFVLNPTSYSLGLILSPIFFIFIIFVYSSTPYINFMKLMINISRISILIIFLQSLQTFFILINKYHFFSQMYKISFILPIGASNSIAIVLGLFLLFLTTSNDKKLLDYFLITLGLSSLLLINNRSVLILLFIIFLIYFLKKKRNLKNIFVAFIIFFLIFVSFSFLNLQTFISNYFLARINESVQGLDLDFFSSGRISLYNQSIERIRYRPLLGYGSGAINSTLLRPHNWILEILEKSGFIGLILYTYVLVLVFYSATKRKRLDAIYSRYILLLSFVLLISLIEPGLLTYKIDFFFGMIIGVSLNINSLHLKNNYREKRY